MKQKISYFKKHRKTILAVIVIIVLILFSGNKGYGLYKNLIRQNLSKIDSLTELNQHKQDSLKIVIANNEIISDAKDQQIDILNKSNIYLYRKIKNREKDLLIIDTNFITNARYISKRANRQYKENDTIK